MNQVLLTKGRGFILAALLVGLAVLNSSTALAGFQQSNDFEPLGGIEFTVLFNGQTIKKTASLNNSFDLFIFPVLLIGSGKCKATVSLSNGSSTELVSILSTGVSYGPYSVIDYKIATADHSAYTIVTIEKCGLVFVVGTAVFQASEDTRTLNLSLSF